MRDANGLPVRDRGAYRFAVERGRQEALDAPCIKHALSWAGRKILGIKQAGGDLQTLSDAVVADREHQNSGASGNPSWSRELWIRSFENTFRGLVQRELNKDVQCRVCLGWHSPQQLNETRLCSSCESDMGDMVRGMDAAAREGENQCVTHRSSRS